MSTVGSFQFTFMLVVIYLCLHINESKFLLNLNSKIIKKASISIISSLSLALSQYSTSAIAAVSDSSLDSLKNVLRVQY